MRYCVPPIRVLSASNPRLTRFALKAFELPGRSPWRSAKAFHDAVELRLNLEGVPLLHAALVEPLAKGVLIVEVLGRRLGDDRRPDEAVRLPVEAALDHPAQDARPLGLQLLLELLVGRGGLRVKGIDVEAPLRRVVDVGAAPACGCRR